VNPVPITRALTREVDALSFSAPITHVYNPLSYARKAHEAYLERFASRGVEVLFLGMNPGPFGMAQTGVPFGEVSMVRDWIGIEERVGKPPREHPKRPIQGFACQRSEVSGRRFWGWARNRFGTPEAFFERCFVWNFCPLVFLEEGGRNRTPDKLPAVEREPLFEACDRALRRFVEYLGPERVIGIGRFAERRARKSLEGSGVEFGAILHPSPASPAANRGWEPQIEKQLAVMGGYFGRTVPGQK
jgi:single-strand selective monofunctional uracil DNA glycosylase